MFWVHKLECWAEIFENLKLIMSDLVKVMPDLFSSFSFGKKDCLQMETICQVFGTQGKIISQQICHKNVIYAIL